MVSSSTRATLWLELQAPPQTSRPKPTAVTTLCHSRRIASAGRMGNVVDQAQTVLIRKLGLINTQDRISHEAREAYARLFEHPLSRVHLTALASLFGWSVPIVARHAPPITVCIRPRNALVVVFLYAMDISTILVWNVRGLNKKVHRDNGRDLIAATRQRSSASRKKKCRKCL